jgi:hypothetical protein
MFKAAEDVPCDRGRADRTWDQRSAADYLGGYPYRLEIRGSPQSVTWPHLCANCGDGSSERLRIRKAFYRHGRGRHYPGFLGYRIVSADVPFCASCAARHRETLPRPSWLRRYRTFLLNPAHIATIGCLALMWMTRPDVMELPLDRDALMSDWGLSAIGAIGAAWTIGVVWMMTRPDRFEPRTEVSLACDVSHDVSQFFERRRYIYGFRNKAFADAFERANEGLVWTDRDQARMWKRYLLATILFFAVLLGGRLLLWYYEGR